MNSAKEILKKYWNYDTFRESQEEIINAVLEKNDVITLLPTGGGKSLCFQIPALIKEGVCIVISPLIALMQDQVQNLTKRGIKATYIASGTSENEIITLFDNIKFGKHKFLYISPERLQSKLIQSKLKELQINLVTIDEAHCISEWGHDFRPAYRNIKILKETLKDVQFIALTATANKKVLSDIKINLELNNPKTFKSSFYRKNLAYQVFTVQDKLLKLTQIFTKTKTPAIVYVNSRRKTEEISLFLNSKNFSSVFFHGGLNAEQKKYAFDEWMSERKKIIVATNAFGMGIDKSNVGIVVHFDLPFSIENYIQESGRAGRNDKKSFAVLLKNDHDLHLHKEQIKKTLPTIKEVKEIHKKLYQNFRIANGELLDESFEFSISNFSSKYNFLPRKVDAVLNILNNNSIIEIINTYNKKSTVIFKIDSKKVISYAINNIYIDKFLNSLLRTYTGLFNQEVKVDEFLLAKKNNCTSKQITSYLERLDEDEILIYNKVNTEFKIKFLIPRDDDKTINRSSKEIKQYLNQKEEKLENFLTYIDDNSVCRSIQILNYFDEKSNKKCLICDVCLQEKKLFKTDYKLEILALLKSKNSLSSQEIIQHLQLNKNEVLIHLRNLVASKQIAINNQNKYQRLK
jgi:ATP-dependent DNA helicase RecQ